jgi:CDP-diacylglycerol--serine O-phosphatidyltransferase
MFFDMLDGRVARMTKTQSAFGLQLDSLADVLSFGAAPALLIYHWSLIRFGMGGLVACFVYVGCGAIRLARFNVLAMDPSGEPLAPPKYIVGLPIPGAAGILVSIVIANNAAKAAFAERGQEILVVIIVLGALMVSNIRFRSFKDLKLNVRTFLLVSLTVASSALISVKLEPAFVLIWLLGCYIGIGILEWLWQLPKRFKPKPEIDDPGAAK